MLYDDDENCMDEAIYASIPKVDTTKGLLEVIRKKFIKFDMTKKHHYLGVLNNIKRAFVFFT